MFFPRNEAKPSQSFAQSYASSIRRSGIAALCQIDEADGHLRATLSSTLRPKDEEV